MDEKDLQNAVESIPEEVLDHIVTGFTFSMPWQYDPDEGTYKDPDGFDTSRRFSKGYRYTRELLQNECWDKFSSNPYMNTAVRGQVGRIAGWGFEAQSGVWDIQELMDNTYYDHRNRLWHYLPKYIMRSIIEGELFLILTLHLDGFVEIDFLDPELLCKGGDEGSGIIFHPRKSLFPLFYIVSNTDNPKFPMDEQQIPSINIARYPELIRVASEHPDYNRSFQKGARSRKHKYRKLGGYKRFVVAWDKGVLTRRAVSYMRTVLEWLNYYENLKKYEIDHKKSSGAYLWLFKITDARTFKLWLSLSDEDRRKTGIMAKKTPGSSLILPPGIEVQCVNPNLTSIKDQDTDIKELVTAGLNEADDAMTGAAKGTYASVKATRGPMSDRTADEISYFDRFYKYDFWSAVFFLHSAVTNFPRKFKVRKAVGFKPTKSEDEDPKPLFKNITLSPERLVDIQYPVSEMIDYETRAKGLLGTKHGAVNDTLGIPDAEIMRRMGFGSHMKMRLERATEEATFPELVATEDAESQQEKALANTPGESGSKKNADSKKG
jgi:hypothetical protein